MVAEVALAALTESKTLAQLATEYGFDPTQITRWKQELVKNAADVFGKGQKKGPDDLVYLLQRAAAPLFA